MTVQTQLKRTAWDPARCVCGHEAKAYVSDSKYHIECNPCAIFTPAFRHLDIARKVFERLCAAVREDRSFSATYPPMVENITQALHRGERK